MRSSYLKRCRELADKKQTAKTVHTSPAYQKLLGHAERLEQDRIPEELFDGYAVYEQIDIMETISASDVSTVLDAVVRMIRKRVKGE